jgi:hypothetical protein
MIEKDIYTIENLTFYISNPQFSFGQNLENDDFSKYYHSKEGKERRQLSTNLFNGMSSSEIGDKLHECYAKWIKNAGEMKGKRRLDTLHTIGLIFETLVNSNPRHFYLNGALRNNEEYFIEYLNEINTMLEGIETAQSKPMKPAEQPATNSPVSIEFKPIFNPDATPQIFDILKDFFALDEQPQLKTLLKSGGNVQQALLFLDNGSRLADTFKQLIDVDIITGCNKKELENWISQNFRYKYRNEAKAFTLKYLNEIISTNKDKCKKPIINVKKDRLLGDVSIIKQ